MAVIFCDSATGSDSDNGSTWALAKATLQAAITAAGAGGTVYLADTHAETFSANTTFTLPAAGNLPVTVITSDVLTGTSVSYVKATSVQLNASGASYDIVFDGTCVFIGVYFDVGDDYSFTTAAGERQRFENCTFELSAGSVFLCGTDGVIQHNNTSFILNQTATLSGALFNFAGAEESWELTGCTFSAASGALSNYTGIIFNAADNATVILQNMDLSGFTGASVVVSRDANTLNWITMDACKLPSGVPVFSTAVYSDVKGALATRCDGNNYGILHDSLWAQMTDADKTRTSGASDGDAFAWKVVTTANCSIGNPYKTQSMPVWVADTGSKTFTVHIGNASADLTDTECWIDIEYLDTASSTLIANATNRNADILAAGTAHTDDTTSSWTGGLTYMQTLSKAVTIGKAGLCQVRVVFIKPEVTVYIDPLVTVS
jgi:hypothetical protein